VCFSANDGQIGSALLSTIERDVAAGVATIDSGTSRAIDRADRLQGLQLMRERNNKVTAEMTERVGAATASEQLQVAIRVFYLVIGSTRKGIRELQAVALLLPKRPQQAMLTTTATPTKETLFRCRSDRKGLRGPPQRRATNPQVDCWESPPGGRFSIPEEGNPPHKDSSNRFNLRLFFRGLFR
jgi:hypothetical protein